MEQDAPESHFDASYQDPDKKIWDSKDEREALGVGLSREAARDVPKSGPDIPAQTSEWINDKLDMDIDIPSTSQLAESEADTEEENMIEDEEAVLDRQLAEITRQQRMAKKKARIDTAMAAAAAPSILDSTKSVSTTFTKGLRHRPVPFVPEPHGISDFAPHSHAPGPKKGPNKTKASDAYLHSAACLHGANEVLQLQQVEAHGERLPLPKETSNAATFGKSSGQVLVASLIQAQKACQAPPHHLFRPIQLYNRYHSLTVKAIIDCGFLYNLISQMLVRELKLQGNSNTPSGLKSLDGSLMRFYDNYIMTVHLQGDEDSSALQQDLLEVNLVDKLTGQRVGSGSHKGTDSQLRKV
ncbi:hypothetical protein MMC07_009818 [Pseudocyphellaria aurata]|nr:hypothetical protein [Pseudocyphellaria aurata]